MNPTWLGHRAKDTPTWPRIEQNKMWMACLEFDVACFILISSNFLGDFIFVILPGGCHNGMRFVSNIGEPLCWHVMVSLELTAELLMDCWKIWMK